MSRGATISSVQENAPPSALVVAEYESLRSESTTRIVLGQNMLVLGLTAFSAMTTVGLTNARDIRFVFAMLPVILLFIALAWARNGAAQSRCAAYLLPIEEGFPDIQWETVGVQQSVMVRGGRAAQLLLDYSGQLLFIVLSLIALGFFVLQAEQSVADYLALAIGAVAAITMAYAMLAFGPIRPLSGPKLTSSS